jgi:hypothetical protein
MSYLSKKGVFMSLSFLGQQVKMVKHNSGWCE